MLPFELNSDIGILEEVTAPVALRIPPGGIDLALIVDQSQGHSVRPPGDSPRGRQIADKGEPVLKHPNALAERYQQLFAPPPPAQIALALEVAERIVGVERRALEPARERRPTGYGDVRVLRIAARAGRGGNERRRQREEDGPARKSRHSSCL